MSQENVEKVRAAIDALNRGDIDAALKHAAPTFEYDASRSVGPQPGVFTRDQMRGFFREFAASWESSRWEADEFIEAGEHVATPLTGYHQGRYGIEVQTRGTVWVWTFHEGSVLRVTLYQERQEALEALGLSE